MSREQPIFLQSFASALASFRWVAVVLLAVYALSNTTVVQPGEVALVLRLGRLYGDSPQSQIKQPGLLFAWPEPIGRVIRIPVKTEGEVAIQLKRAVVTRSEQRFSVKQKRHRCNGW
jgi:regulator of protease activity HflC (stomatin/prohibitin superfamily)